MKSSTAFAIVFAIMMPVAIVVLSFISKPSLSDIEYLKYTQVYNNEAECVDGVLQYTIFSHSHRLLGKTYVLDENDKPVKCN